MHRTAMLVILLALVFASGAARAENNSLLIQLQPGGSYRIWYADGPSVLEDEDVMLLDAAAEVEGSAPVKTALGMARALRTSQGVVIELADVGRDRFLLVDRDACGHVKTWHAEGGMPLSEDQATDLFLAALPGGGARVVLDGERHAKSFLTNLGAMVAIWKPRSARR